MSLSFCKCWLWKFLKRPMALLPPLVNHHTVAVTSSTLHLQTCIGVTHSDINCGYFYQLRWLAADFLWQINVFLICPCNMSQRTRQESARSTVIITLMVWGLEAPKPQGHNNLTWGRKSCPGQRPTGQLARNRACTCATGFPLCCLAQCWADRPARKTNFTAPLPTVNGGCLPPNPSC